MTLNARPNLVVLRRAINLIRGGREKPYNARLKELN